MINKILESKIIPVIRTNTKEEAIKMVEACYEGGAEIIELTYSVPDVCEVISHFNGTDIIIGIGSVLNVKQAEDAIAAGAKFVVSPGTVESVIEYCNRVGIIYMPGCMTISEMINVIEKGCKVIKLFPGSCYDPSYISAIKAPMPNTTIMVTGGVDLNNIQTWLSAGVDLVGVGSALNKAVNGDDYSQVSEVIRKYKEKCVCK